MKDKDKDKDKDKSNKDNREVIGAYAYWKGEKEGQRQ